MTAIEGARITDTQPTLSSKRAITRLAWGVTLLVSALPDIAWVELTGGRLDWLPLAKIGLLLGLTLATVIWRPLRPLRHYFLVLLVFFGLAELRPQINFTVPALQALFGNSVFDARMQAEQLGKLVVSFVMIVTLLMLGYTRRDFFLTRGNLRAPIEPVPLLGFPKPEPWSKFGLQWAIYIAVALAVMQYFSLKPNSDIWLKVVPILPSILFYAALNSFNEEVTYRSPMLATLEPIGGSRQALWLAAYFFGIAHYFGTPGGILGGMASIFMGWILGKGMIETRGLFWTWWIHFLSDIAIFLFLAVALLQ